MNDGGPSLRLWMLGLAVLVLSVAGASWVLHARSGDGTQALGTNDSLGTAGGETRVMCMGHVDAEPGVVSLYPLQPGRVAEVLVREDDVVKAGTVLFRLDDRLLKLQVQQAEADVKAAQAQLADAKKLPEGHELKMAQQRQAITAFQHRISAARHLLTRRQQVYDKKLAGNVEEIGAATDAVKELEAGKSAEEAKLKELQLVDPVNQIARAEADLADKKARLEQAQYALDECAVRAPSDGKVLRLFLGQGDVLGPQPRQPALQFCPAGIRIIRVEIEQEFAGRVAKGQVASIQDDNSGSTVWKGKVIRVSDWFTHRRSMLQEPLEMNDVRTLECIVEVDPNQPPLRIGQRVRVLLSGPVEPK
jgi:multidrug resistance efflux pump